MSDPLPAVAAGATGNAPINPNRNMQLAVILAGLITTALTLFGVWATDENLNIMGQYVNFIPFGALIVGAAAGSGYGLAAWFGGVRVRRWLCVLVICLQFGAYATAQYIPFASLGPLETEDGEPVSFFDYYDFTTRTLAWQSSDSSSHKNSTEKEPEPLGAWGYAIRAAEVGGFIGGSILIPLLLLKLPYCDSCQLYMRRKKIVWVPAGEDSSILQSIPQASPDAGAHPVAGLVGLARSQDAQGFREAIQPLLSESNKASGLPARLRLQLAHCRCCDGGRLNVAAFTGSGRTQKSKQLENVPLSPGFVRTATA